MLLYNNKVYNVANQSSKKHSYDTSIPPTSIRPINREWKKTNIDFIMNRRKTSFPVTSLFDIVKDKKLLAGAEKVFNHDQLNARLCKIIESEDTIQDQCNKVWIEAYYNRRKGGANNICVSRKATDV